MGVLKILLVILIIATALWIISKIVRFCIFYGRKPFYNPSLLEREYGYFKIRNSISSKIMAYLTDLISVLRYVMLADTILIAIIWVCFEVVSRSNLELSSKMMFLISYILIPSTIIALICKAIIPTVVKSDTIIRKKMASILVILLISAMIVAAIVTVTIIILFVYLTIRILI